MNPLNLTDEQLDNLEIEFLDVPIFDPYEIPEINAGFQALQEAAFPIPPKATPDELIRPHVVDLDVKEDMNHIIHDVRIWLAKQGALTDAVFDYRGPVGRYGNSDFTKLRILLSDPSHAAYIKLTWG